MNKRQAVHTEEFRRETVRLLENSGKSVPELAREMGVNEKSLYRWRAKHSTSNGVSNSSKGAATQAELEAEIKRLRRDLKTVEQERDILKKAISIFSRSQP